MCRCKITVQLGRPERETRSCIGGTNVRGASQSINTPSNNTSLGFDAGVEDNTEAANTHSCTAGDPELAARTDHRPPQTGQGRMPQCLCFDVRKIGKDVLTAYLFGWGPPRVNITRG